MPSIFSLGSGNQTWVLGLVRQSRSQLSFCPSPICHLFTFKTFKPILIAILKYEINQLTVVTSLSYRALELYLLSVSVSNYQLFSCPLSHP